MRRRTWCLAILIATTAGCGSSKQSAGDAGGDDASGGHDGGGTDGPGGGNDAPPDATGFEPFVPDYFDGKCTFIGDSGAVPDEGSPFHGLTVVAKGLTGVTGLEVDGTNAYLASATSLSRLALAGGTPEVMVMNAKPVAIAIDASNIYWSDARTSGRTDLLRAPLTATGLNAMAGASNPAPELLVSEPGAPGAFTMAGGYLYFTAGNVIWRVSTAGGSAQMVYSGLAPTGIAVEGNNVYLGDDPNEAIQFVTVSGQFAGLLQGFSISNATPTQLTVSNGILYWGDWYGSIEWAGTASPTTTLGGARTPCGGAGCYPNHLRPAGTGAVWEAGDDNCSSVGKVDTSGSTYFAVSLSRVGGIAVAGNHLYAVTDFGQLLRFDL